MKISTFPHEQKPHDAGAVLDLRIPRVSAPATAQGSDAQRA
jgi:hypothetical protein